MKILQTTLVTALCTILTLQGMVISADVNADVNGDGKVSAMDILLVKKNVLNVIPQTVFKFDINNDGLVNAIDVNLVKKEYFCPPVTEPPQTEPPVTDPPFTEPPATDTEPARTVIDGHGNVYTGPYAKIGDVCFLQGNDGYETAQNYATAIEEYYGILMSVSGSGVMPACYENLDITGTLEELNAWRAGRSPEEIGPAEISNNWSLIGNDYGFTVECMNYLESLQLVRDFLVFN